MTHNKLNLPGEKIDRARELAKNICAPVLDFIDVHTTVTVERATLRLLGVDGVSSVGVPVPNLIVDALGDRLGEGAAIWYSNALLQTGLEQSELDKRIEQGFNIASRPMGDRAQAQEYATRLARRQFARIDANRAYREARLEEYRGNSHSPLLYLIVATGNIYEDVKQAQAAALAGADVIAVIRTTAQSLLDYVPFGPTTEGFGGTYATQENFRIMRRALDEVMEREKRYIYQTNYASGLCMPEIAAMGALERLDMMHPDAVESTMVRTYLEWLVELPWSKSTKDNIDIKKARGILDKDHYDLDKVKDRILEFLSVMKLKADMKGPILCFVGPPGVGKTSLGKSIARAIGRKFSRISLGGMKDEAEIRGHRRTYVGSMPGRIIQYIKIAGTNNPVFMMDEIDKIGNDFRGDPASALLEVLDPEQNNAFSDHYLNVPFDLSKVMFITTANQMDTIPSALRDRMEVIDIPGYTEKEKLEIAKRYLIPKQLSENGLTAARLGLTDRALEKIINEYTREAGLRNLEREIAMVARKVARRVAEGDRKKVVVTPKNVHDFLGPVKYLPDSQMEQDYVGVASGLAWTEFGGDVLYIEASCRKGKKELTLTGNMGEVMKESAQAALTYIKSKSKALGIEEGIFDDLEMHIHVPQGAIPKDGPSAGITMAVAMISAITGRPINRKIAMTGEITLTGRVLAIGGLKEKTLAALRNRMEKVLIPHENDHELVEIPPYVKKKITFLSAKTMDDVVAAVFGKKV